MKQTNLIMKDNNILIANFLGWKGVDDGYDTRELIDEDVYNWGAIMAVVEKIETLETKDGRTFTIDMHRDSVLIFEYGTHTNEIVFTGGKGRLQNLYNACVEFVEWWNKENN